MTHRAPCHNGHAKYHYVKLDETRVCVCEACGQQWTVHLGKGLTYQENETDSIANATGGLEFIEMMTKRAAAHAARRCA